MAEKTHMPDDAMYLIKRRDELAEWLYRQRNHHKTLVTLKNAKGEMGMAPNHYTEEYQNATQSGLMAMYANLLLKAQVVLWRPDLLEMACKEACVYNETVLTENQVPSGIQWWPRIDAMDVVRCALPNVKFRLEGALVFNLDADENGPAALNVVFIHSEDGYPHTIYTSLNVGHVIHKDSFGLQKVLASLDFMSQDFTEHKIFRGAVRQGFNKQKHIPVVRSIQLRARIPPPKDGIGNGIDRQYEHSWMVTGHRRRLREPRKSDGQQVVWVKPYVKGDTSKPLLPRKETIVRVSR